MDMPRLFRVREREAILALVADERSAVEQGDWHRYATMLAEDAVFMPPNLPAMRGAALRTWLEDFLRRFRVEWLDFASETVAAQGDLAYHAYAYTWRVTPRAGGEGSTSSGKGLHLLRRQPEGTWKVVREIWNDNP